MVEDSLWHELLVNTDLDQSTSNETGSKGPYLACFACLKCAVAEKRKQKYLFGSALFFLGGGGVSNDHFF